MTILLPTAAPGWSRVALSYHLLPMALISVFPLIFLHVILAIPRNSPTVDSELNLPNSQGLCIDQTFLEQHRGLKRIAGVEDVKEEKMAEEDEQEKSYSTMTMSEIWEAFGCEEIFESPRPVHSKDVWSFLRGVYLGIMGTTGSTISNSYIRSGFQTSVTAKQSEGKGRGVFANKFIKKGELVWSATYTARFDSGEMYRRFLASIPISLACDVLQWAYVQVMEEDLGPDLSRLLISVDLDEGSLMNSGYDNPNIGFPEDSETGVLATGLQFFALRDVPVGEELLCNYDDFVVSDGWAVFGL
jgi:hypothetical protein